MVHDYSFTTSKAYPQSIVDAKPSALQPCTIRWKGPDFPPSDAITPTAGEVWRDYRGMDYLILKRHRNSSTALKLLSSMTQDRVEIPGLRNCFTDPRMLQYILHVNLEKKVAFIHPNDLNSMLRLVADAMGMVLPGDVKQPPIDDGRTQRILSALHDIRSVIDHLLRDLEHPSCADEEPDKRRAEHGGE